MEGENIIYKIADFGLAKMKSMDIRTSQFSFSAAGTRCYMAPEIIRCLMDPELSHPRGHPYAVDIFSLGVIFYWLLVGKLPFTEAELINDDFNGKDKMEANVKDTNLRMMIFENGGERAFREAKCRRNPSLCIKFI